jgi:hypothetical protein
VARRRNPYNNPADAHRLYLEQGEWSDDKQCGRPVAEERVGAPDFLTEVGSVERVA